MAFGDFDLQTNLMFLTPMPGYSGDVATPTSNTAATVVYNAIPGYTHVFYGASWGYTGSGTLAGGLLTVTDGSTQIIFSQGISAKGQGTSAPARPKYGTPGNSMTITLAAGSANVTGTLTVDHDQFPGLANVGMDLRDPVNPPNLENWLLLLG